VVTIVAKFGVTGTRYITIGGENFNGKWSVDVINNLIPDINQKKAPAEY
jgi:hypothetical protein